MSLMKNILVIIGSAGSDSANEKLIDNFEKLTKEFFKLTVFSDLKKLPHFDTERSINNTPPEIEDFRNSIEKADAVIICTPEYIFSIPSGLKNCLEWCVSTTVFSEKPVGLITASASGIKGHEELQLIMKTLQAKYTSETTLLIQGIKGKINSDGEIIDNRVIENLVNFARAFKFLVD